MAFIGSNVLFAMLYLKHKIEKKKDFVDLISSTSSFIQSDNYLWDEKDKEINLID